MTKRLGKLALVRGKAGQAAPPLTLFSGPTVVSDVAQNPRLQLLGGPDFGGATIVAGNLRLPHSTASVGIIRSGADRFIHNFGTNNFFAGVNAGNLAIRKTERLRS